MPQLTRRKPYAPVSAVVVVLAVLLAVYAVPIAALLWIRVPWPVVTAAVVLLVLWQWLTAERRAIRRTGARPSDPDGDPELHAVLDRVCALYGVPKPRVAVSPDLKPNAFTIGRSSKHATIVVTAGLLRTLEPEELTVALAHEIAHIRHRDVTVMTLAGSLSLLMGGFARSFFADLRRMGKKDPGMLFAGSGGVLMVVILPIVSGLFSVIANLPLRALGRWREYAADDAAAHQTGCPALLAATLVKIDTWNAVPLADLRATAIPAFSLVAENSSYGPWATHPPVPRRVDRLTRT